MEGEREGERKTGRKKRHERERERERERKTGRKKRHDRERQRKREREWSVTCSPGLSCSSRHSDTDTSVRCNETQRL